MTLGIVKATVVSTRKHEKLKGSRLLLIEPLYGKNKELFVATDKIGAGIEEIVLVSKGGAARDGENFQPIDATIVGIIDYKPELGK